MKKLTKYQSSGQLEYMGNTFTGAIAQINEQYSSEVSELKSIANSQDKDSKNNFNKQDSKMQNPLIFPEINVHDQHYERKSLSNPKASQITMVSDSIDRNCEFDMQKPVAMSAENYFLQKPNDLIQMAKQLFDQQKDWQFFNYLKVLNNKTINETLLQQNQQSQQIVNYQTKMYTFHKNITENSRINIKQIDLKVLEDLFMRSCQKQHLQIKQISFPNISDNHTQANLQKATISKRVIANSNNILKVNVIGGPKDKPQQNLSLPKSNIFKQSNELSLDNKSQSNGYQFNQRNFSATSSNQQKIKSHRQELTQIKLETYRSQKSRNSISSHISEEDQRYRKEVLAKIMNNEDKKVSVVSPVPKHQHMAMNQLRLLTNKPNQIINSDNKLNKHRINQNNVDQQYKDYATMYLNIEQHAHESDINSNSKLKNQQNDIQSLNSSIAGTYPLNVNRFPQENKPNPNHLHNFQISSQKTRQFERENTQTVGHLQQTNSQKHFQKSFQETNQGIQNSLSPNPPTKININQIEAIDQLKERNSSEFGVQRENLQKSIRVSISKSQKQDEDDPYQTNNSQQQQDIKESYSQKYLVGKRQNQLNINLPNLVYQVQRNSNNSQYKVDNKVSKVSDSSRSDAMLVESNHDITINKNSEDENVMRFDHSDMIATQMASHNDEPETRPHQTKEKQTSQDKKPVNNVEYKGPMQNVKPDCTPNKPEDSTKCNANDLLQSPIEIRKSTSASVISLDGQLSSQRISYAPKLNENGQLWIPKIVVQESKHRFAQIQSITDQSAPTQRQFVRSQLLQAEIQRKQNAQMNFQYKIHQQQNLGDPAAFDQIASLQRAKQNYNNDIQNFDTIMSKNQIDFLLSK